MFDYSNIHSYNIVTFASLACPILLSWDSDCLISLLEDHLKFDGVSDNHYMSIVEHMFKYDMDNNTRPILMFQIAGYSLTDEYSQVTSEGTDLHLQSFQHGMLSTVPDIVSRKIHCNMCVKTFTSSTNIRRHKKEQHEPQIEMFRLSHSRMQN